jgi:adenylate cyclase
VNLQEAVNRKLEWLPVPWRVRVALSIGLIAANLMALLLVFLLLYLELVPLPDVSDAGDLRRNNFLLSIILVVLLGLTGLFYAIRDVEPMVRLLETTDRPTDEQRLKVLDAPLLFFIRQAVLWAISAAVFGVFNALADAELGLSVALVVALAGLSVSSVTYLITERSFRPLAGTVLAYGLPDRLGVRRVATRLIFAWALGTGIALFGIIVIGVSVLTDPQDATPRRLAITMVVLGGAALIVGSVTNLLAARASSDPILALRQGIADVRAGDFDTRVHIYDGTEVGVLQAGFNDMVAGLQERETIRELFGKHVGDDVARQALEGGVELGGEVRDVAVLFVDIVGSTTLAEDLPPERVVGLLNRFFDVVIEVVHQYDGWINKFQGDAALAIWGAPMEVADRDSLVLAAARVMGRRLREEVPELSAGIGVSAGRAVAGNVGAAERYEYTVIGDPVNEAARLTDVAKTVPGGVVANAKLLLTAGGNEVHWWSTLEPVVVRGRSEATEIAAPRLNLE